MWSTPYAAKEEGCQVCFRSCSSAFRMGTRELYSSIWFAEVPWIGGEGLGTNERRIVQPPHDQVSILLCAYGVNERLRP